jgi:hypothetical protein
LTADPLHIEAVLERGGRKARAVSEPFLDEIRRAVGVGGKG